MTNRSAALLYPGEMGCAVGKAFVAEGWAMTTHLWGPSLVCGGDADAAGIRDCSSLDEAISGAGLVISLVPPTAALETARAVSSAATRTGARPLYLDGNSVGPETVSAVAEAAGDAGLDVVDGAFIGSAAAIGGRTRLYLSGPRAGELARILPAVLQPTPLGDALGSASALKLAFAGFNKGLVALFLEVMGAGGVAGARDELLDRLREFYPGTVKTLERLLPSYPRHAARRAEEMGQLAEWLASERRDDTLALAVAGIFERFAALGLDPERSWTLPEVLDACLTESQEPELPADQSRQRGSRDGGPSAQ